MTIAKPCSHASTCSRPEMVHPWSSAGFPRGNVLARRCAGSAPRSPRAGVPAPVLAHPARKRAPIAVSSFINEVLREGGQTFARSRRKQAGAAGTGVPLVRRGPPISPASTSMGRRWPAAAWTKAPPQLQFGAARLAVDDREVLAAVRTEGDGTPRWERFAAGAAGLALLRHDGGRCRTLRQRGKDGTVGHAACVGTPRQCAAHRGRHTRFL